MSTPYTEGRLAGYRNEPLSLNPYLKGLDATSLALAWAMEWIRGYVEGTKEAADDVIAKRIEGTR